MNYEDRIYNSYKDIAFFSEYYLGIVLAKHQIEMIDWIETYNRSNIQQSRDHGKTTSIAEVYPVWKICFNPNIRILFVSKTLRLAKKNLNTVKRYLEMNESLIEDFGEFYNKGSWEKTSFTISQRTNYRLKEATCECVGVNGNVTGGHYDLVICDDIVDDKNLTEEQINKTIDWMTKTILPLISADENEDEGALINVGTPKSYSDIHKWLEDNPRFATLKRPCILQGRWWDTERYYFTYDKNGVIQNCTVKDKTEWLVLWPERQIIEKLLLKKAEIGSDSFLSEYMLEIRNEETALFKKHWLEQSRTDNMLPMKDCSLVIQAIDFAYLRKKTGDYTVIITVGVDNKGNYYVYDMFRQRGFTPTKLKNSVISEYHKYYPAYIFGETNNMGNFILDTLIEESDLPIKRHDTTKHNKHSETEGIKSLAVLFENNKIKIPLDTKFDVLISDLFQYDPKQHTADTMMALWIAIYRLRKQLQTARVKNFRVSIKNRY